MYTLKKLRTFKQRFALGFQASVSPSSVKLKTTVFWELQ